MLVKAMSHLAPSFQYHWNRYVALFGSVVRDRDVSSVIVGGDGGEVGSVIKKALNAAVIQDITG